MKLFGKLAELSKILFRQNGQEISLDSNTSTTYTADREIELPPGDQDSILVGENNTQTLTNKTIDGDDNTISDISISSLKTVAGDADKVIRRDNAGVIISGNTIPNNSPLVTTDSTQTLTNKTIDGDDNTIQDISITALKSSVADADKVIRRDASGVIISGNNIPNNSPIVTTDSTQTLSNKTIDGDDNTIQDISISSLKTDVANADKVIRRDSAGVVISGNNIPNSSPLITTDSAQTLSNKTIVQPIIEDFQDVEILSSSPASPSSGYMRMFFKNETLFRKNSSGVEVPIGAGGSGLGINFVNNSDLEINLSDISTYDDGAAIPIDGTGGTVDYITITRNTTAPLNGQADLKISKSANPALGEGVAILATVPKGYQVYQPLELSFLLDTTSAGFSQGDIKIYIYDITNSNIIYVSNDTLPNQFLGRFTTYFSGSDASQYRILFHVASTSSSAYDIFIDDIKLAPGEAKNQLTTITRWQKYTPTFASGSVIDTALTKVFWRQVGENIELDCTIVFGAGSSGSSYFTMTLPNNYNIDASRITYIPAHSYYVDIHPFGPASFISISAVNRHTGIVSFDGLNTTKVIFLTGYAISDSFGSRVRVHTEGDFNAGDVLTGRALIPCFELRGSGALYAAETQEEHASNSDTSNTDNTTAFQYGEIGQQFGDYSGATRKKRVRFTTPIKHSDIEILVSRDGGNTYESIESSTLISSWTEQNGVTYGMSWEPVNDTDIDVLFGQYRKADATSFGGAGSLWSDIDLDPDYVWLVRKRNKKQVSGFNRVSEHFDGLAPSTGKLNRILMKGSSGHGSSATRIRRMASVDEFMNTGGIVFTDSPSNGLMLEVKKSGIYSISYTDAFDTASHFGITINIDVSLVGSTDITSLSSMVVLGIVSVDANKLGNLSITRFFKAGDKLYLHTTGAGDSTSLGTKTRLIIQRIL